LLGVFFNPEGGGDIFLQNVGSRSADYTTSQKIELFITITLRIKNPTIFIYMQIHQRDLNMNAVLFQNSSLVQRIHTRRC
jgi:hypothetical protein